MQASFVNSSHLWLSSWAGTTHLDIISLAEALLRSNVLGKSENQVIPSCTIEDHMYILLVLFTYISFQKSAVFTWFLVLSCTRVLHIGHRRRVWWQRTNLGSPFSSSKIHIHPWEQELSVCSSHFRDATPFCLFFFIVPLQASCLGEARGTNIYSSWKFSMPFLVGCV